MPRRRSQWRSGGGCAACPSTPTCSAGGGSSPSPWARRRPKTRGPSLSRKALSRHVVSRAGAAHAYGRVRRWLRFALQGGYRPRALWETWGGSYSTEPGRKATGPEHQLLAEVLDATDPQTLVEVGCGFGRNLRFVLSRPRRPRVAVGIDLAVSMLREAQTYA